MPTHGTGPTTTGLPQTTGESGVGQAVDPRQRSLAMGLEYCKRVFEAETLEDLYMLLTNDVRILVDFDRSSLVVHLGGTSRFTAAALQPVIEKKSKFHDEMTRLAAALKGVGRGLLLSKDLGASVLKDEEIPPSAREAIQSYIDSAGCAFLFCIPLTHDRKPVGHLILEFFETQPPNQISILTLLNISPFLGAALAEKWLADAKPALMSLMDPDSARGGRSSKVFKFGILPALVFCVLAGILLLVPVPFDVGGETEIVPTIRHVAFCGIEGLIDKVHVHEGSKVEEGQVLADLDPRELDYKVATAERQVGILTAEMDLLKRSAGQDPSKLAESEVTALKRKAAQAELEHYKWQQQFQQIKSPTAGIVLTKDIESLSGKKFMAGEAFCEIVAPGNLSADTFVPEDKITHVKTGDPVTVYLSGNPRTGYDLAVSEMAPMAEALPRLGNVYRVRAPFPDAPPSTMVGMRGIGKIHTMNSTLWFIVSTRVLSQWRQLTLHF
ncbi:MAG: HlyD family efflux transporter periplasmic adaptor subunit [Pseudomonadota bacterium]